MIAPNRFDDRFDEPDHLREQVRSLLRYRIFIVLGVALGVLGGIALGTLRPQTYVSTGEVLVRSTADPFSMATEREMAHSAIVAARAAEAVHEPGNATQLQRKLRVTVPANSQIIRFEYSAHSPRRAARLANAFVQAYLADRKARTDALVGRLTDSLKKQMTPLAQQRRLSDNKVEQESLRVQIRTLQKRIDDLNSQDTAGGDVVRRAEPPSHPSGPQQVVLIALGGVVGLAFGILIAWLLSVLEPRVRSVTDVQRALRAPVLGILPGGRKPKELLVVGRATTPLAEVYRSIAFRMARDEQSTDGRKVLVVAPRPNRNAAAVAANIAAAFAEIGDNVLLLEADPRNPKLARQLPVAQSGSSDGRRIVDAGRAGRFTLLPGTKQSKAGRTLTTPSVIRLLKNSESDGSVVVLTRPLLAHADGLALARRVDGVIVVCNLDEDRRDELERVHELVTGAGGRVLGAVLDMRSRWQRIRSALDITRLWRRDPDLDTSYDAKSSSDSKLVASRK